MLENESRLRLDIQGIRAIAIMAVIVFHYSSAMLPGGFVGVDMFLVISGYLVTNILISRKNESDAKPSQVLFEFYAARIKRIAPAYYFMLLCVAAVAAVLFIEADVVSFHESLKSALFFNSNNYFAGFGDYFAPTTNELPLLHTWSLAVEMQFYLILPLITLLFPTKWVIRILIVAVFLGVVAAQYTLSKMGGSQQAYYSLFARIPEFLIGSLLAFAQSKKNEGPVLHKKNQLILHNFCSILGLLLIGACLFLINKDSDFPGLLAVLPTVGTALLIYAKNSSCNKVLKLPFVVFVGNISYSLYLWHWPILAFIRYYTGENSLGTFSTFVFIIATTSFSCLSYFLIEKKFKFNFYFGASSLLLRNIVLVVAVIVGILLSPFILFVNARFAPSALPIQHTRYADQNEICHGKIVDECLKGELASARKVLVLGDSHAAMLNHFFDHLGKKINFSARVITASSCVTIPNFDYQRIAAWAQESCLNQIKVAKDYVSEANVIVIAGMWSYHVHSKEFLSSLEYFLSEVGNKRVVVFSQIPQLKIHTQRARRFIYLGLPVVVKYDESYREANKEIMKIVSKFNNAEFVDQNVGGYFNFVSISKIEKIYMDDNHLNEFGVNEYARSVFHYPEYSGLLLKRFAKN